VKWTHLAQDRVQPRSPVSTTKNFRFPYEATERRGRVVTTHTSYPRGPGFDSQLRPILIEVFVFLSPSRRGVVP
jgi:hypothetical protein